MALFLLPRRSTPPPTLQPASSVLPAWEWCLLGVVLAYGLLLRSWDLGSRPYWVDEAETGINALTILEHGLPVDHYLGLPIFENILTRPWPESPEYEFKDTSYSDRGLAVYHGWLPLYLTAASFALAGVEPDQDPAALSVRHSPEAMRRRTVAGRIPAVVFGAVFLVAVFFAAREFYGPDAAWAALAASVVCRPAIDFARQARYYSATLALTTCCCLLIGRMVRRGWWRDFLLGAVALILLFHTHTLSFAATCAALLLTVPWLLRRPRGFAKLAVLAGVVAVGVLPWVVLTGFADAAQEAPKARSLLDGSDLLRFLKLLGPFPVLAVLTVGWVLLAKSLRGYLPGRLLRPFADYRWAFLFLAGWALFGFLLFIGFMPAASYFYGRLALTLMGPGLLFGAMLFAAVARAIVPRYSAILAPMIFVLALVQVGQADFWRPAAASGTPSTYDVVETLRTWDIQPGTRLYATPNQHLVLTFYTGLPVQDVAPVRKAFLDAYAGPLVILEAGPRYEHLTCREIRRTLLAAGHPLPEAECPRVEALLATRLLREDLQGRVARVIPPLEPAPDYVNALVLAERLKTVEGISALLAIGGNPMYKGYHLRDFAWWQVFYYRFVDPAARTGPNLNYAARVRSADAFVLPGDWVLFQCLPRPAPVVE